MARFAPTAQLAAVIHHWGGYYTEVASAVLANAWRSQARWGGIREGLVQLTALVTVLSLAPSLLVMMTAFTRIVIVLSLLRGAIGTQGTPPNMVRMRLLDASESSP